MKLMNVYQIEHSFGELHRGAEKDVFCVTANIGTALAVMRDIRRILERMSTMAWRDDVRDVNWNPKTRKLTYVLAYPEFETRSLQIVQRTLYQSAAEYRESGLWFRP